MGSVQRAVTQVLAVLGGRGTRRLRPIVVGGLAGLDLTWQSLARLSAESLGGELLPAVTSFLVGGLLSLGIAPDMVAMPLYGYLIYTLTPVVFPNRLRHVTERRDFRLLAAGLALLVPIRIYAGQSFFVVGWVVLALYLVAVQRRSFIGVDGYPITYWNAFLPATDVQAHYKEDLETETRPRGFWAMVALVSCLAIGLTFITFLVLGGLVSLLFLLYPFPELLCLGWVGYKALVVGRIRPGTEGIEDRRFDIESRAIEVAGVATEGAKGLTSVILAGFGLIVPVIFVYISTTLAGYLPTVLETVPRLDQRLAVVFGFLTIALCGLYGVWYWFRTLFRLPHVMVAWRSRRMDTVATPPDRELGSLLGRPPGYYLPVTGLLLVFGLLSQGGWPETVHVPAVLAMAWIIAFIATGWSIYRGLVGDPQSPETDLRALPVAYVVNIAGAWLWIDLASGDSILLGVLAGTVPATTILSTIAQPMPLTILGILMFPLYGFFLPDLDKLEEQTGWRQFLSDGYLLATGLVLGGITVVASGMAQLVSGALTLFVVLLLLAPMWKRIAP